jgi:hypothetical protein
MLEHPIAVALDEFELMLTALAAHRLPILPSVLLQASTRIR